MTERQAYEILKNTPIRAKENHTEYSKALRIAIGVLGRQIPKNPVSFMGISRCPICRSILVPIYKFCPECGQAFLWDGDTE